MKKVALGIAMILFGILLKLCSVGSDTLVLLLGLSGLIISFLASIGPSE